MRVFRYGTRSRCNARFWVACTCCALGLAACASDDEPHDRASGGSGDSGGVVASSGGREGSTGGRDALGGSAGMGLAGATTRTGDGGSAGAQGGADGTSGAAAGGQAGTPGAAGKSNGGEGGSAGAETETGGAAGGPAAGGAGGAGSPPKLNGCTAYVDRTAPSASRTLVWDAAIAVSPERCLKIRVAQEVVFDGDFDAHPLEPLGGDSPSPFSTTPWAFARPGIFGYACTIHGEMTGAIWVVP